MKKQLFIFCFCLFTLLQIQGQTNTFPNSGNVGIGTTTPSTDLEIEGGNGVGISLFNNQANYWDIVNSQYGKLDFVRGKSNIFMRITQNGNVGIGTISPNTKLQVEGRTAVGMSGVLNLDWTYESDWGGNASKWSGYIGFNAFRSNNDLKDYYYRNNNYTKRMVFEGSQNGFRWLGEEDVPDWGVSTSSKKLDELMVLKNNGNLGIGTTSPDSRLTVKGNIHTNEVKVDLLGAVAPDYVFYKDYGLKTLHEVENYISKHGHLPNIPSARTMETDGIKLKEMNLKLLEKIEELTLYSIQQEKRIHKLEQKNNTLTTQNQRIVQLEEKLESLYQLLQQ